MTGSNPAEPTEAPGLLHAVDRWRHRHGRRRQQQGTGQTWSISPASHEPKSSSIHLRLAIHHSRRRLVVDGFSRFAPKRVCRVHASSSSEQTTGRTTSSIVPPLHGHRAITYQNGARRKMSRSVLMQPNVLAGPMATRSRRNM
ncbi:hypothetical protein QR685DRAFT_522554 [Neurospora intermedia]|uniref:Questionable protein n=1 Tax=Neurospora intermedia TaxID=5142 RepID=A0ABR3DJU3_NEUIN